MRVNLDDDEYIIAILPKVWLSETSLAGLLKRRRRGSSPLQTRGLYL